MADASKLSFKNEHMLGEGAHVGCFYCVAKLSDAEVRDLKFHQEKSGGVGTGICPRCGVDSLVNLREVLSQFHEEQFGLVTCIAKHA
jgi:hypothetical protein